MTKVRAVILGAALLVTMAAGIGTAKPVAAGWNGQQLAINASCDANWAFISGTNQRGQYVHQWVNVPADFPGECGWGFGPVYDWGWWWRGWVRLDGYWNRGSGYGGTTWVNVPVNQTGDWTYAVNG